MVLRCVSDGRAASPVAAVIPSMKTVFVIGAAVIAVVSVFVAVAQSRLVALAATGTPTSGTPAAALKALSMPLTPLPTMSAQCRASINDGAWVGMDGKPVNKAVTVRPYHTDVLCTVLYRTVLYCTAASSGFPQIPILVLP